LTIRPFVPAKEVRGLVTILFEDTWEQEKRKSDRKGRKKSQADRDERLQETERELAYTRETLQATVEELQASNEELKSTNEELQSTNEELETSREELQSMNEELTTVNSELQGKIEQLFHSEEDMRVLLENTNIETAAREFAESIVETIRDPLVVLDGDLQVVSANRSFYTTFQVSKEETEKRLIYELGNCQWDIPEFRKLLGEILPQDNKIEDYLVEHDFPGIGRKRMLLNARRIISDVIAQRPMILLAIEDVATHRESLSGKQPA
jgi:two-component system CheB/CheR fusion protein